MTYGGPTVCWSSDMQIAGFEDYGAYWRYNYETIEEDPQFRYTRDELMNDVRSAYNEVDSFMGQILMQDHVWVIISILCCSWSDTPLI